MVNVTEYFSQFSARCFTLAWAKTVAPSSLSMATVTGPLKPAAAFA
jgi:hypothetical protein